MLIKAEIQTQALQFIQSIGIQETCCGNLTLAVARASLILLRYVY